MQGGISSGHTQPGLLWSAEPRPCRVDLEGLCCQWQGDVLLKAASWAGLSGKLLPCEGSAWQPCPWEGPGCRGSVSACQGGAWEAAQRSRGCGEIASLQL